MKPRLWFAGLCVVAAVGLPLACSDTNTNSNNASDAGADGTLADSVSRSDAATTNPSGESHDASSDTSVSDAADAGDAQDAALPATSIFPTDGRTLALLELNGDLSDVSGNGRPGIFYGPDAGTDGGSRFTTTSFGQGLMLPGTLMQGIDWSQYAGDAGLLSSPFTVELVFVPSSVLGYHRLFTFDLADDDGQYIDNGNFSSYPNPELTRDGGAVFADGVRSYVALVFRATDASLDDVDVYIDGVFVGTTGAAFKLPPVNAFFFEDNTNDESMAGVVDAIRVSSGERSADEIASVQARLAASP